MDSKDTPNVEGTRKESEEKQPIRATPAGKEIISATTETTGVRMPPEHEVRAGEGAKKNVIELLKGNEKALNFFEFMEHDDGIQANLEQANVVAIGRLKYNDHGVTHSRIVTYNVLQILDLLYQGGVVPNIMREHNMKFEDAQLICIGGAYLHDLGNAIHRMFHYEHSMFLAEDFLDYSLKDFYKSVRQRTFVKLMILESLYAHDESVPCLSVESGCVCVADGCDMVNGRARVPFSRGKIDIHSVSALAIESVEIIKGEKTPVRIEIKMTDMAGIFQIQNVLGAKIATSGIKEYLEVVGTLVESGKPHAFKQMVL